MNPKFNKLFEPVTFLNGATFQRFAIGHPQLRRRAQSRRVYGAGINKVIKEKLAGRALVLASGDLTSPDKILEAVTEYADIASAATMVLIDLDRQKRSQNAENPNSRLFPPNGGRF